MDKYRRALVTGASAGLGETFAQRLAREGSNLIIVARDRKRLEQLAACLEKEHRVSVTVMAADLTKRPDLEAVEEAVKRDGHLDLLINNAGFGTIGRFAELDLDKELNEIQLNVLALVRLTHAALPGMIRRKRGGIINVSSLAAFQPGPFNATYAATKAYVKSFTESLSEELRGTGVRVQVLCPGFTRTEFQERAGIDTSQIPSLVWMSSEEVVDDSLAALRRARVVCVPGIANRFTATMTGFLPGSVVRHVSGRLARRLVG
jgi:hypothetical protein